MKTALVCPDGLSVSLFCRGIIRALLEPPGSRVVVLCDEGDFAEDIIATGARTRRIPMARYATPRRDLAYLRNLYAALKTERVDLVLNFSTKPNIYGSIAARLAGVPRVVSHVVGLGTAFLPPEDLRGRALRELVLLMYRLTCRLSDKVWFTNENDVQYFLRRQVVTRGKVVVSRNYLDTDVYAPGVVDDAAVDALRRELRLDPGGRVVVMVARLIWEKGIREFVESAERLRARYPDAAFVLLAPPETGARNAVPEDWVRTRARAPNLRYLPFLRDVRGLYAIADLAVLPSYYKEGGYPRALLEPMSMGKPIITTDCDDTRGPVDVGGNGYLVPPRDAGALAEAIARVLDDPVALRRFGRHSRAKACREFDEGVIVRQALMELGVLHDTRSARSEGWETACPPKTVKPR